MRTVGVPVLVVALLGGMVTVAAADHQDASVITTRDSSLTIPPLACQDLLWNDDVERALAVWARSRQGLDGGTMGFLGGEGCEHHIISDESVFVRLEPGDPMDLSPDGADSRSGRPIPGIGDVALLSHLGKQGRKGVSTLRIAEHRDVGELHLRLTLGRPDLSEPARGLELARLARSLLPRFPGTRRSAEVKDLTVGLLEEEPRQPTPLTFVDNLRTKEQAGEWTRGEGLLATLRLFAGEAERGDVLLDPGIPDQEGTGILDMAQAYLEHTDDQPLAEEVERLLGLLVFSDTELENMSGGGYRIGALPTVPAFAPGFPVTAVGGGSLRAGLARVAAAGFDQEVVEDCGRFFRHDLSILVDRCLEVHEVPRVGIETTVKIYAPVLELPGHVWEKEHYDIVKLAAWHSAFALENRISEAARASGAPGGLPSRINIVFTAGTHATALATATQNTASGACYVALYANLQWNTSKKIEHTIAHELSHCFQSKNFPDQHRAGRSNGSGPRGWWVEGTAEFLAHRVYPTHDREWRWWVLSFFEQSRWDHFNTLFTLIDLRYETVLFWQFLEKKIGTEGIFKIVAGLPTGDTVTTSQYEASLAAYPLMDAHFHEFLEDLMDGTITDTGSGFTNAPYLPKLEKDRGIHTLDGPTSTPKTLDIRPFGIGATLVKVRSCKGASLRLDVPSGNQSARPISASGPEDWGPLHPSLPEDPDSERDRVILWSSSKPTQSTFDVPGFWTEPGCEEETPASPWALLPPCLEYCAPSDYFPPIAGPTDP